MANLLTRALWGTAAALAVATSAQGVAQAQPVKPNILIIFDTSGSMQWNGPGDVGLGEATNICPSSTGSRLWSLKYAIRETLAVVGTDEVNFGLQSFPTLVNPGVAPVCYSCPPSGCSLANPGNTYAGHFYISNPDGQSGCGMTTHTTAGTPTTYGAWFDSGVTQALRVDVTKAAAGTKPTAGDFDPTDANIARIYTWMNNVEDTGAVGALSDPELHAMGATPLGRSLFYARMYFDNYVKPADPRSCRQNIVILVTDGGETCDSLPGSIDPATCVASGGSAFNPLTQACSLYQGSQIKVHVLTDSTVGGSTADGIAQLGGTGSAIKVSLADIGGVKAALVGIIAGAVPASESCNGQDDNCNGLTDEGVSNQCPFDAVGLKHCAVETCNCKDDDCNGKTDDGLPPNPCGGPCGCVGVEICNGVDDDCDDQIDEGFGIGGACDNGKQGACKRSGVKECGGCSAPDIVGTPEICNGIDDDCDGMTDEDKPLPGEGDACGSDLGMCKTGKAVCKDGKLTCDSTSTPKTETCNGIDDDCNGLTDDGEFPDEGKDCLCPGLDASKAGVGECKKGKLVCKGAMGLVCEGCTLPMPELCDGKDNDCDGTVDTGAMCPSGFGCKDGQCAIPCSSGEFPCPACYKCNTDKFCIKQLCCGVNCAPGLRCDEDDGKCKDPCKDVMCAAPKVCSEGRCIDCHTTGCPNEGERCIAGTCRKDPCAGITCSVSEYCDNGTCIPLCVGKSCAPGETCVAGACRSDLCSNVACAKNQYCESTTGQCKDDPCALTQCEPGTRCIPEKGKCEADPCSLISCLHECLRCETTSDGVGQCVQDPQCKSDRTSVRSGGGGGCGCATGGDAHGALPGLVLLLGLVAMTRRRGR